jgi:hypothetical protein
MLKIYSKTRINILELGDFVDNYEKIEEMIV